jgi:hypothetical protein
MFGGYSPLPMNTHLGNLSLHELRLCHKIELHVAWQQLDLHNSAKINTKLTRYIEWGESCMFSPPSTLGMRFHLCTRVLDSEWSHPFDVNGQKETISGLTSCLTLKQLTAKKRDRNIGLVGGASGRSPGGGRGRGRDGLALGSLEEAEEEEDEEDSSESDAEEKEKSGPNSPERAVRTSESGQIDDVSTPPRKPQKRTSVLRGSNADGYADSRCQYDVGIHSTFGKDVYFRTTVVTFLPRYMLVNDLRTPITIAQSGREDDWKMTIPGGTSSGFHWPFKDSPFLMIAKLETDGFEKPSWNFSGEFSIDTLGETCVKIRQKWTRSEIFLIRVNVKLVDASIIISFETIDEFVPYRIDNETSHRIRFRQSIDDERQGFDSMTPRSTLPYSWDQPLGWKILEVQFQQGSKWVSREYKLDTLVEHHKVKLTRTLPDLSQPECVYHYTSRI